jgi:hypothetical protein
MMISVLPFWVVADEIGPYHVSLKLFNLFDPDRVVSG